MASSASYSPQEPGGGSTEPDGGGGLGDGGDEGDGGGGGGEGDGGGGLGDGGGGGEGDGGGGDGEAAMSDSSLAFRIAPILMSGSALVTVVHARNSATRLCNASGKGPQFRKGPQPGGVYGVRGWIWDRWG